MIVCVSFAFSVRLIDPLSKELTSSDSFVGSVAPGNKMELIFSKELTNKYQSLEVVSSSISNSKFEIKYEKESIKLFVFVPANADIGREVVRVKFVGSFGSEVLDLGVDVVSGALGVSPVSNVEVSSLVDSKAGYKFYFVNNTDAEAVFLIESDLPPNWVNSNALSREKKSLRVVVPKRSSTEDFFVIYPRIEGEREFKTRVSFENTSRDFSFKINALPTLKSKLQNVLYGIPFYSFSLLPSYFLNGLISFGMN
ncbi:MAG: hypothetical protein ACOX1V_00430 [Candidatus Iainarchaeum sp.]